MHLLSELSVCSMSSGISESSGSGSGGGGTQLQNRDFKIVLDLKAGGGQMIVHLMAPTMQVLSQLASVARRGYKSIWVVYDSSAYLLQDKIVRTVWRLWTVRGDDKQANLYL